MHLKEFLQLAGQQGKVVVVGEDGSVKGVFLSFDEYQKLSGGNGNINANQKPAEDITEKINREILQAQLEEVISLSDGGTGMEYDEMNSAERIDSLLSKRAQELFKSVPFDSVAQNSPHENFRSPEVASSSDEEISTNFDDI